MAEHDGDWWEYLLLEFQREFADRWVVHEKLGQGNSAAVFRVESATDGQAALKVYKSLFFSGPNEVAERYRISLHEKLKGHTCDSLVKILEVGYIADSAYVLMEYIPWSALDSVLGAVPVDAIPSIIADVAKAAKWLDERSLAHRDIKPANILVAPDFRSSKLVDLGVMRESNTQAPDMSDQGARRPFVATAQYSSPEYLFRLHEPSSELWRGLSIYQLGAVLHDLLVGKPLFHDEVLTENRYVLAMAVYRKTPVIPAGVFPAQWAAVAKRALGKDLSIRLQSVGWDDFANLGVFDLKLARERLGLDRAADTGLLENVATQKEQARLLLKSIAHQLRDALAHRLRGEGYQRVRWIDGVENCVWLGISVPNFASYQLSVKLELGLEAGVLSVNFAMLLAKDARCECDCKDLLWQGNLESFSVDLSAELVPLISEVVLKGLSQSYDQATIGIDDNRLPMLIGEVS